MWIGEQKSKEKIRLNVVMRQVNIDYLFTSLSKFAQGQMHSSINSNQVPGQDRLLSQAVALSKVVFSILSVSCQMLQISMWLRVTYPLNRELQYENIYTDTYTQKLRPGGKANTRNYPGMWLLYSDSTRRGACANVAETSWRMANSGISGLWSWKFRPNNVTFLTIMSIFRLRS